MTYDEKVKTMLEYLKLKIEERDWHGVMDLAADLREIEQDYKTRLVIEAERDGREFIVMATRPKKEER